MSEAGYVELPVIQWLSGLGSTTPNEIGLGWTYRDESAMAVYERPLDDPLVEKLLIESIIKINPAVQTEEQARIAVDTLRRAMGKPDALSANRLTLDLLRDGVKVVLTPGGDAQTVNFIEFDPTKQHLNDFTVTNQYRVQGVKQCRDDMVLLVNGIPLIVAEYKSYVTSGKDWREAVNQLHRYQRQAPLMLACNVFCIAADEEEFRYGSVLFHEGVSEEEITCHLDTWGPWLSLYPERKGFWNTPEADKPDDPLEWPVKGLLRLKPCHVLDFLQHFIVFETKKGRTAKKVARYQQFESANDLVDRTLQLVGKPVDAQQRTGLIWHTQGSGKSLTMIFAANKLRRQAALNNPTVLIVVDRRDLKTQLSDDFFACDYPNVEKALGVADLTRRLKSGWRGTLVTTIQSFQKMADLPPIQEDNIISLVDECHRTQKSSGAQSYAMTMRFKLPNAFRFGFTGTPIDRAMNNTHRDFGPIINGQQERYLSYYGIKRSIKDGATLEVHYIRDRVPFKLDKEAISTGFEAMCAEMELEDEEAKDFIQRKRSQWKELARHPERIGLVLDKMLAHFLDYPDPNGFKAQLVAVDRRACAAYKDALDAKLKERGLPPEWSEVIISEAQNDDEYLARFHYGKQKQDDLIDYFKLTPTQWEDWNHGKYGKAREQWRPPLKILLVCDRLITGFDAPIEQVMYLDKPLRDHNLLQAITRTNRPFPSLAKRTGVVVDYFGVFANLEKALNFDENIREESLIDWDKLKQTVPGEVERCMDTFAGIAIQDTRACLLAALRKLQDGESAKQFEQNFKSLSRLWEAISPDPCLYPHRFTYQWLSGVFVAHRRRKNKGGKDGLEELWAKTRKLIEENISFKQMVDALPVFKIDQNYTGHLEELPSAADKAAALEAMLSAELTEDGGQGFVYRLLGERLQTIKQRKDASDKATEDRLQDLRNIAEDLAQTKTEPERLNLTQPGEYALFTVLRGCATTQDEGYLAECARRMLAQLQTHQLLAPGWSRSKGGRMRVGNSLLVESWNSAYAQLGFNPDDPQPAFVDLALTELAGLDG